MGGGDKWNQEYCKGVFLIPPLINKNGLLELTDYNSKYINVINGKRITLDMPTQFDSTIYLFGKSPVFGFGVSDNETIASYLQKLVNTKYPNKYRVLNCGINGVSRFQILKYIKSIKFKKDDIIIILLNMEMDYIPKNGYNISDKIKLSFDRPHNLGEVFWDYQHINCIATKEIAKRLFDICLIKKEQNCDMDRSLFKKYYKCNMNERIKNYLLSMKYHNNAFENDTRFIEYINKLKSIKVNIDGKIGSIVMNCNPLTLGHMYLIESALKKVEFLYIFVVEENKSFFSFDDRYRLVNLETKQFNNVLVIPSGNFILSNITFPEYFVKESIQEAYINPSKDIEIFAQYIAPTLNISLRFAGEEPIDYITKEYNNCMKSLLPKYNIEFIEIPRKSYKETIISASRIRNLIIQKDFKTIKHLVPSGTYEFLLKKYSN